MFNIFKRKGKQIMLTDEQIKLLTPEQKAELLSKLQVEETDTESQTATIEVEATDTVEETTAQVEEVVEEVVQLQEEPTAEEKQFLTELYLETKLEEVNRTFEEKFNTLIDKFGAQLDELNKKNETLVQQLAEAKRTAPLGGATPTITQPALESPREVERIKSIKGWTNSPSTDYVRKV